MRFFAVSFPSFSPPGGEMVEDKPHIFYLRPRNWSGYKWLIYLYVTTLTFPLPLWRTGWAVGMHTWRPAPVTKQICTYGGRSRTRDNNKPGLVYYSYIFMFPSSRRLVILSLVKQNRNYYWSGFSKHIIWKGIPTWWPTKNMHAQTCRISIIQQG